MEVMVLTVAGEDEESRLDIFMANSLEEYSRSYLQKLISDGLVEKNGIRTNKKNVRLKTGDVIRLTIPEPEPLEVAAQDIPLDIVYEDEGLLVVNKAKGMVVHPAPGNREGTLVNALLYHCDRLSSINGIIRPGIVHRIDKDTTGLLVVAKTDQVHRSLARQMEAHEVRRVYYAVVEGVLKEESATIEAPIGRDPNNRLRMAVVENGKRAVTHVEVIRRFRDATLVKCLLETGRTHQIRVHLAMTGHPIIGDTLYGRRKSKHAFDRQALHAKQLSFYHPLLERSFRCTCPMAPDMKKLILKLKKRG